MVADQALGEEAEFRDEACLECVGGIQSRIVMQPVSLDSDIHARMSLRITDKFRKIKK
jgi:hypothetical protein